MDAWLDLNTRVLKTLEYPLIVTILTFKECQRIFCPILEAGLLMQGFFTICIET